MIRAGCLGCLTALVLAAFLGGVGWGLLQMSRAPDIAGRATSAAEGLRAQQKIFDLLAGATTPVRPRVIALSEGELNAFLARHLGDSTGLPLRNLAVRLSGEGQAEIAGQIPLRSLLTQPPFSSLNAIVPTRWLDHPVWILVRADATVEAGERSHSRRRLRLDVRRFCLGRQPLPEPVLRLLLDPAAVGLLRWPLPDAVGDLRVEPGRLVIKSAS